MVLLLILAVLCTAGFGVGVGMFTNINLEKKLISNTKFIRKRRNAVILSLVSLMLIAICFFTLFYGSSKPTHGAEVVAQVKSEGVVVPLWYDSEADEYFVSKTNCWNILNVAERSIVNKENAEKYIELYNELKKIDMKGSDNN